MIPEQRLGHRASLFGSNGGTNGSRRSARQGLYTGAVIGLPSVAAVVPAFNRARVVLEALDSIAAQTLPPTKLIVVDDGSTDDTADRIERWLGAGQLPFDARLIRQANAGPSAARNRAAAEANGCDLLAFLDSDDLWPADYLSRMVEAMAASPPAAAASSDLRKAHQPQGRGQTISMSYLKGQATASLFRHGASLPSATVVRADAFHRIGGFEPRYDPSEDFYLCACLSLHGPWLHVPGAPVVRRLFAGDAPGRARQLTEFDDPASGLSKLCMLRWFIHADGGSAVLPRPVRQKRLARDWYRLGRSFARSDQPAKAIKCFKAALRRDPWLLRAHRRRIMARMQMLWGKPAAFGYAR